MRAVHEALLHAVLEEGQQAIVVTTGVDQYDGTQELAKTFEGHDFKYFFESAAATGQGDDGLTVFEHARLARMHVGNDIEARDALMSLFDLCEKLWNNAVDPTAVGQRTIGHRAHQAAAAAAVVHVDAGAGQGSSQSLGRLPVFGGQRLAGSGINCDALYGHEQKDRSMSELKRAPYSKEPMRGACTIDQRTTEHHAVGSVRSRVQRFPCVMTRLAAAGLVLLLAGCQSEPDSGLVLEAGQSEYLRWCASCHGNAGEGKPPAFPPLAGSEWLAFSDRGLAMIVLYGLRGEIEVAGQTYRGYMPPMSHLPDSEIAAILGFINRTWGVREQAPDEALIAAIRAAEQTRPLNGRADLEARLERQQ